MQPIAFSSSMPRFQAVTRAQVQKGVPLCWTPTGNDLILPKASLDPSCPGKVFIEGDLYEASKTPFLRLGPSSLRVSFDQNGNCSSLSTYKGDWLPESKT